MKKIFSLSFSSQFVIGVIIILGALLRFVNYQNRWGLAADQAQFWIVSKYALNTFQIPLLGPFSSGGPFQTGGEWYWIVMMGHMLMPSLLISPWIFLSLVTLLAVGVMIVAGWIWEDKRLGFILGILIATSPVQIAQSSNLTNQTPIILFSSLSLLFMIFFVRSRNYLLFFMQVLFVGIATSVHIQAVALMPFCILTAVFFVKNYIKGIFLFTLGISIPWIPVLIADSQNHFYNTINMLTYYSHNQSQVSFDVLGRRWLTFGGQFIPESWGQIVGGSDFLGYFSICIVAITALYLLFKKKLSKELWVIFLSTFLMIIILRYTRTPLFESFFVFLHPFIFLLTGLAIYYLIKIAKIVGIVILIMYIGMSLIKSASVIKGSTNYTAVEILAYKENLAKTYPNKGFRVYDYDFKYTGKSLPLVLQLYNDGLLSDNGVKIGLAVADKETKFQEIHPSVYGQIGAYQLFNLSASSSAELGEEGWAELNPAEIYRSVQHWYDKK